MKHFFKIAGGTSPDAVVVAWLGDNLNNSSDDTSTPEEQAQKIPGLFEGVETDGLHQAVSEHFAFAAIVDRTVRLVVSVDTTSGDCHVWRHAA